MRNSVVPERVANHEIDGWFGGVRVRQSLAGKRLYSEGAGTFSHPGGRPIFTEKLTSDLRGVTRVGFTYLLANLGALFQFPIGLVLLAPEKNKKKRKKKTKETRVLGKNEERGVKRFVTGER